MIENKESVCILLYYLVCINITIKKLINLFYDLYIILMNR